MYVQNRDRCLIARHPGPCECRKRQGRFQARPGEVPGSSLGCDLVPRWDHARAGRRVSRRWRQPHASAGGERKWTDRKEKRTWTRERASHGVRQPRPSTRPSVSARSGRRPVPAWHRRREQRMNQGPPHLLTPQWFLGISRQHAMWLTKRVARPLGRQCALAAAMSQRAAGPSWPLACGFLFALQLSTAAARSPSG
ncbi:hypothetical protein BT67DRAFT_178088 [Trichocladium antarcticum]|uniref:Uncharacterized protein n=1 Tax=Trichocladium antarcticum TaxID=1450529 RepID=A0AAN6ZG96_9PEZI|nr:hypothetical protein BT67DRAFT_178088 [Trichocladium antarcticum]